MRKNQKFLNTNLLKFLAIVFVINSHMRHYYPISFLGTGGSIGNSLFFMLSAYGLWFSFRNKQRTFEEYYLHRIQRIYWPVWIALTFIIFPIYVYFNEFKLQNILDWFGNYFYPPFWFLQILLLYYFIAFFILKEFNYKKLFIYFFIGLLCYIIYYFTQLNLSVFSLETIPFRFLYYFITFLLGFYIASNVESIKFDGIKDVIILLILFLLYGIFKFIIYKGYLTNLQLIVHVITILIIYYMFKINKSKFIQFFMLNNSIYISRILNYLGSITLEIYIVHAILFNHIFSHFYLNFPINVIMSFLLAFLFASILNIFTKYIKSFVLLKILR